MKTKVEVFQGKGGRWYWRMRVQNGKIVADGSQGYASKGNVERAVDRFLLRIIQGSIDLP